MIKVCIYSRVSKTETFQTVERQVMELREFAKAANFEVVAEVQENISGRKVKRSGTAALIELARARKINKVIIHEVSRLGRNHVDTINTGEELRKYKVSILDFQTRNETLDSNGNYTDYGVILFPLFASLARKEVEQSSFRIKSGQARAVSKGIKIGRPRKEKFKKQDEIIKLLKAGTIHTDIGKIIKASNRNIAKYLGVAVGTVKKVRQINFTSPQG